MTGLPATGVNGESVFLTGATGYLGAFLLHELLAKTDGDIYCLVRAQDQAQGLERLLSIQDKYRLSGSQEATARIRVLPGNITKPGLGLPPAQQQAVIAGVDRFIHCAASTNFLFGAGMLHAVNLEGTRNIVELALQTKGRRLHHVSSASLFLSGKYGGQVVREDLKPAEGDLKESWGYQFTKYEAEDLIRKAGAQGLRANLSRPWFIGPHSATGIASGSDFMLRLIDGCLALGLAPEIDIVVDIMPVDWVSRAIVELALNAQEGCYYLGNPVQTTWHQVVTQLAHRRPVRFVPYAEWRAELRKTPDNPAWIFMPLLPETYREDDTSSFLRRMCRDLVPQVEAPLSMQRLAAIGRCPPFHGAVLNAYLDAHWGRRHIAGRQPPDGR